jgi:hypothetical protein
MKILVPAVVSRDIGPLDHAIRLPMSSRLAAGMSTKCDVCGTQIKDETFVAGFKAGRPNLKIHESCAVDQCIAVEERKAS